jgi:hypothetical protein
MIVLLKKKNLYSMMSYIRQQTLYNAKKKYYNIPVIEIRVGVAKEESEFFYPEEVDSQTAAVARLQNQK